MNEIFPKGIDQQIVVTISEKKDEPDFLKKFRLDAFSQWQKMPNPDWAYLGIPPIDYQDIQYYSVPKTKKIEKEENLKQNEFLSEKGTKQERRP